MTGMMEDAATGYLHYICALPEARGTGIASALIAKRIGGLLKEGAAYIYLTTDDFRLGAIKTYLKLGLLPVIEDEEDKMRWNAIHQKLKNELPF